MTYRLTERKIWMACEHGSPSSERMPRMTVMIGSIIPLLLQAPVVSSTCCLLTFFCSISSLFRLLSLSSLVVVCWSSVADLLLTGRRLLVAGWWLLVCRSAVGVSASLSPALLRYRCGYLLSINCEQCGPAKIQIWAMNYGTCGRLHEDVRALR
jgi:hypothetical protein